MSAFRGRVLHELSRLLDAYGRDAVLGDLAELDLGFGQSVCELCGLILRQQAALWKHWAPWLALVGIVGSVGVRLTYLAVSLAAMPAIYLRTYLKYGVRYESGLSLTEEVLTWVALALAVLLWSWTGGFAFTSLSRKTALFTGVILCIAWLGWNGSLLGLFLRALPLRVSDQCWSLFLLVIPSVLFFLPAAWGARRGFRRGVLPMRQTILLAGATLGVIALVTWTSGWPQAGLVRWSEGAMRGGTSWHRRLMAYLLLSWPAAYIVTRSSRHRIDFRLKLQSGGLEQ